MSISLEQIQIIQAGQADTQKKPVLQQSEEFSNLLASKLDVKNTKASTLLAPPPGSGLGLATDASGIPLQTEAVLKTLSPVDAEAEQEKLLLSNMTKGVNDLIDGFERYTNSLNNNSESLKNAHSLLQDLSNGVKTLRLDTQNLSTKNPSMENILNELDVLATTERFKFNRGDYL
ncbi:hypothetical protein [Desulfovibrio litoralis]|uniref:Uncharacterized protein n=1 Tax=Desulfovibrio litoralis DSM 11393 TaxID=1121455 RepID=A0A1M7TEI8_9BACT|nr:hypothetical protein [Desulfovibrio litoralis]SHN69194.1 hypothetical protein SAMN02745728_01919 [Desulfovibrio litoralis DSM 11393]